MTTVSDTRSFWKRGGAGTAYDAEFKDIVGWYVNESELRPFADLFRERRGAKVLDVGCGTGRHLALFHPSNELFGLDLSSEMLACAAERVPQAKFLAASADTLPFENDTFDIVLSVRVLQHIQDQEKFVEEMVRVCKPGGQVALLSYNSWSLLCLYKQIRMSRIGRVLNIPFKLILGRRSFFNPWGFTYDNYCSVPEISGWMRAAGVSPEKIWGATLGQAWFWNDFFIGKVLQRTAPAVLKLLMRIFLWMDHTLARHWPLKYFSEKVVWVGSKKNP